MPNNQFNNTILPKVAVLLTVFNGTKYLNEQVKSILKQKNVNTQIFISVDNSSDGSEELVQSICDTYDNVICLEMGKKFGSAQKNFYHIIKEVNFSQFDYVCLSDQDDIWLDNKIYRAVSSLINNNCEAYSSNATAFWETGLKLNTDKAKPQKKYDYLFESGGPGCTYVFNANVASKIKSFIKEKWNEVNKFEHHDWLIYAFVRSNNLKWFIDKESFILYRQHSNNQLGVNLNVKSFFSRLKEVWSGNALDKVRKLITILNLNNIVSEKPISRLRLIFLAFNTHLFRRKKIEQIYLSMYFLILCISKKIDTEGKLKVSNSSLSSFFIGIISFSILLYILSFDQIILKNNLKLFSSIDFVLLIFISILYLYFVAYRFFFVLKKYADSELKQFFWYKLFLIGQIAGLIIPQSGIVINATVLKNSHSVGYFNFFKVYFSFLIYELLILLFFLGIFFNYQFPNFYLKSLPIGIFISTGAAVFLIILIVLQSYDIKIKTFLLSHIAKIMSYFIILKVEKVFLLKIIFYTLFKFLFRFLIFVYISQVLNLETSIYSIFILFVLSVLLDFIKITPQNIGISEIIIGLSATQIDLAFHEGALLRLYVRSFDYISFFLVYMALAVFEIVYKSTISLKN